MDHRGNKDNLSIRAYRNNGTLTHSQLTPSEAHTSRHELTLTQTHTHTHNHTNRERQLAKT